MSTRSLHITLILSVTSLLPVISVNGTTEVTLCHGGKLRGQRTSFQNIPVDLFLGIRYAQPPICELRFKKPKEVPSWEGVVDALQVGNICAQGPVGGSYVGDEDCLFLDLTVPGGIQSGAKKPVMVFFHGGAYVRGAGSSFIGGPLAVTGDVIVVSINYRLGILGFLADGPGTGNYGLWDQRAALLWVKQNIKQFGGDPDLVTIFGQSAGAGSVAAQTMGQHSDGLFKRAIQQSGSLYDPWSWYTSEMSTKSHNDLLSSLRDQSNCQSIEVSIYDCLQDVSTADLITKNFFLNILDTPLNPTADSDFFPPEVNDTSYKLSERFDLMSGFNEQEGLVVYYFFALSNNMKLDDRVSEEFLKKYLKDWCTFWFTPYSTHLCVDFLIRMYKLDESVDDRDRCVRLIELLGDHMFVNDGVYGLEEHSRSSSTYTYAYYFTEVLLEGPDYRLWPTPKGIREIAGHLDELKFVFGSPLLENEQSAIWSELIKQSPAITKAFTSTVESDKELSRTMMLMWSNFAKSGNPNLPVPLPAGTPTWPEFNTDSNQFMELNSKYMRVITTPNKERLHKMREILYLDRNTQHGLGNHLRGKNKKCKTEQKWSF